MPMSEYLFRPVSICYVLSSFGMYFTRIYHSFEYVKVDPPDITAIIGLFSGLIFSLGNVGRRYMDVAPLSNTPDLLFLFSIFLVGSLIMIEFAVF